MKILKVISSLVAVVLTGLSVWLCVVWSKSLYIAVTEPELLVLEQIGVITACLALIATIWLLEFLLSQVFE